MSLRNFGIYQKKPDGITIQKTKTDIITVRTLHLTKNKVGNVYCLEDLHKSYLSHTILNSLSIVARGCNG